MVRIGHYKPGSSYAYFGYTAGNAVYTAIGSAFKKDGISGGNYKDTISKTGIRRIGFQSHHAE
ncbi:MAG: hypothetical protein WCH29_11805 [Chitinophagaceae bacterium]